MVKTGSRSDLILVIAGEASGDMHGAALIAALRNREPALAFCGIGGDEMKAAGVSLFYHVNDMAFLGLAEVIKHLPFIRSVKNHILETVTSQNIRTAILIDYPGFNLSIARNLKNLGLQIFYYISPQLWAWGKRRVKKIRRFVDTMLVLFPFEMEFYKNAGVHAEFVGHPLIEKLNALPAQSKSEVFRKFGLNESKDVLLLMPGSRAQEVSAHLPEMLNAAKIIAQKYAMQIVIACAPTIDRKTIDIPESKDVCTILSESVLPLMKYARFGIIKSGTSTLEAGFSGLPFVLVYKTSRLTYTIAKMVISVKYLGIVNIIADEPLVPELIQHGMSSSEIVKHASAILDDPARYESLRNRLFGLRQQFGTRKASEYAAQIIVSELRTP